MEDSIESFCKWLDAIRQARRVQRETGQNQVQVTCPDCGSEHAKVIFHNRGTSFGCRECQSMGMS